MCILCTIRITHHKTYIHTQYPMGNIQHTVFELLSLTEHIHFVHTYTYAHKLTYSTTYSQLYLHTHNYKCT